MANTNRRYVDKNGNMFIPMNVEGASWDENFITTSKLVWIVCSLGAGFVMYLWLSGNYAPTSTYIFATIIYLFLLQLVIRYIVFEEKFYYKMYKQMKESQIATPAAFWNIASVKETMEGAILTFADAKIAILMRLERDTIIGKEEEFVEQHFDAISEFYNELVKRRYSFIQMNIMEPAGNDPRLHELSKLIDEGSDNPNVTKLIKMMTGYIRDITRKTLYESDYVMIISTDINRVDQIIDDAIECAYKIQDGAYLGYYILSSKEIIEFIKDEYGVGYFNLNEATLNMFRNNGVITDKPFKLLEVVYSDEVVQKLGSREVNKLRQLASCVNERTINQKDISIRKTLFVKQNKNNNSGIDFESLGELGDTRRRARSNSESSQESSGSSRTTRRKESASKSTPASTEKLLDISPDDILLDTDTEILQGSLEVIEDEDENIDF